MSTSTTIMIIAHLVFLFIALCYHAERTLLKRNQQKPFFVPEDTASKYSGQIFFLMTAILYAQISRPFSCFLFFHDTLISRKKKPPLSPSVTKQHSNILQNVGMLFYGTFFIGYHSRGFIFFRAMP